jgi:hypothetical protein
MKLSDIYSIKEIDKKTAQDLVVKNHYLHRKAPCSKAFGLFDSVGLVGVCMYGQPSSPMLCKGICGEENKHQVIELTRLWIKDNTPQNVESFLVGNTIKKLDKEIIVSYADSNMGHLGVIYQASNFLYTGITKARKEWGVKNIHSKSLFNNGMTVLKLKEKYGSDLYQRDRTQKHRYIYFNCSHGKRKYYLSKLKYTIMTYPKK